MLLLLVGRIVFLVPETLAQAQLVSSSVLLANSVIGKPHCTNVLCDYGRSTLHRNDRSTFSSMGTSLSWGISLNLLR